MSSASEASHRRAVALAGATGKLGKHITNALLLPEFMSTFSSFTLLSRQKQEGNAQLEEWTRRGAKVVVYDEARLVESLQGVDVLINV